MLVRGIRRLERPLFFLLPLTSSGMSIPSAEGFGGGGAAAGVAGALGFLKMHMLDHIPASGSSSFWNSSIAER